MSVRDSVAILFLRRAATGQEDSLDRDFNYTDMADADDIMFMDSEGTDLTDGSFSDQDPPRQNMVSTASSYHFVNRVGLRLLISRPYLGLRSHL